jgi:hypothetical protein
MAGSRAEKTTRRRLLDDLARELSQSAGPAQRLRAGRRRTMRLIPYVSLRRAARGRLRVYCVSDAGLYALLTGDGQLIRLDDGITAAARAVAAACCQAGPGEPAADHAAAAQPRQ